MKNWSIHSAAWIFISSLWSVREREHEELGDAFFIMTAHSWINYLYRVSLRVLCPFNIMVRRSFSWVDVSIRRSLLGTKIGDKIWWNYARFQRRSTSSGNNFSLKVCAKVLTSFASSALYFQSPEWCRRKVQFRLIYLFQTLVRLLLLFTSRETVILIINVPKVFLSNIQILPLLLPFTLSSKRVTWSEERWR